MRREASFMKRSAEVRESFVVDVYLYLNYITI